MSLQPARDSVPIDCGLAAPLAKLLHTQHQLDHKLIAEILATFDLWRFIPPSQAAPRVSNAAVQGLGGMSIIEVAIAVAAEHTFRPAAGTIWLVQAVSADVLRTAGTGSLAIQIDVRSQGAPNRWTRLSRQPTTTNLFVRAQTTLLLTSEDQLVFTYALTAGVGDLFTVLSSVERTQLPEGVWR